MFQVKKGFNLREPFDQYQTEKSLDGDTVETTSSLEFGDQDTDGSWRIIIDNHSLLFQKRESGVFNTKAELETVTGSEDSNQGDSEVGTVFEDTINGTSFRFALRSAIAIFSMQKLYDGDWNVGTEIKIEGGNEDRDWKIVKDSTSLLIQYRDDEINWQTALEIEP